jgi:biopolymer transport protein ExbB
MSFSFLLQADVPNLATKANEKIGVKEVPIWDIIDQSNGGIGWVINLILLIMFGYSAFIFVERYLALQKASKGEKGLLNRVKEKINSGDIEGAKAVCAEAGNRDNPSARMIEKGIARLGKPLDNIATSIENTGKLEVMRLEQRLSFLATASGAGPMIGFFGTVVGMVVVFIDLQNAANLELKIIAPGMMTAMVTTVEGLIVGIVSFMGYNHLAAKVGKIIYQMENTAIEFIDILHQPGK